MKKAAIYPTHKAGISISKDKTELAGIEEVNPLIVKILKSPEKCTKKRLAIQKGYSRGGLQDILIIKLSLTIGQNELNFLVVPNKKWFVALVKEKQIIIFHNKKSLIIIGGFNTKKIVEDLEKIPNKGLGI